MHTHIGLSWRGTKGRLVATLVETVAETEDVYGIESAIGYYVDMHWDTGAPSEYVVMDGSIELGRFPNEAEAKAFAEATYMLRPPTCWRHRREYVRRDDGDRG